MILKTKSSWLADQTCLDLVIVDRFDLQSETIDFILQIEWEIYYKL